MLKAAEAAVRFTLLFAVLLALAVPAVGQDLRANLFSAADELIAQGMEVRADVLSPKSWGKAMERYNSAEQKFTAGKILDDIRKELNPAVGDFRDAIKATELAKVTMATFLKARDDAASVAAAGIALGMSPSPSVAPGDPIFHLAYTKKGELSRVVRAVEHLDEDPLHERLPDDLARDIFSDRNREPA